MRRRTIRRTRIALAGLLLSAATLMVVDARGGEEGPLSGVRSAVGEVAGPVQQAAAGLPRAIGSARSAIGGVEGAERERLDSLQRENEQLAWQLRGSDYDRNRADALDALLGLAGRGQYKFVPARVIAVGAADGFSRTVTIDAGSDDGVRAHQTVVNGQGLVGRVKTVSSSTSTVVLLIDVSSTVGVRLENLQAGYAKGAGGAADAPLNVELFSPSAVVEAGDRMVTFGSRAGTPFVAGVPVGEVIEVHGLTGSLTKRVEVRPFVDFGALDLVGVVVEPPRRDPRNAVLPPAPVPSQSAAPEPEALPVEGPVVPLPSRKPTGAARTVAEGRG